LEVKRKREKETVRGQAPKRKKHQGEGRKGEVRGARLWEIGCFYPKSPHPHVVLSESTHVEEK